MPNHNQLLIISQDQHLPENVSTALNQLEVESFICEPQEILDKLAFHGQELAGLLAVEPKGQTIFPSEQLGPIAENLDSLSINMLTLTDDVNRSTANDSDKSRGMFRAWQNESVEMIKGRLAALIDMNCYLHRLHREIDRLQVVGRPLSDHFSEVTEEMQLACRLQHDFLPKQLPEIDGLSFSTVYRPATWVSGDIYDVMRLDEDHIGFYVADAVGHGMPAALLTIFIKRAIVTKRITGNTYELINPAEVLSKLNHDLVEQNLSDNQFATCCYVILNYKTLQVKVSNAGHPMPMLIENNEKVSELDVKGPLLGVFEDIEYDCKEFQLHTQDKLMLYSDGLEDAFIYEGPDVPLRFRTEFEYLAHEDVNTMCQQLLTVINSEAGSLHPRDDVTIVGIEFAGESSDDAGDQK